MRELVSISYAGVSKNDEYEDLINRVVNECFANENLDELNLYVSVMLTTPSKIKELNKCYRNIDNETDVLSFPMFEKSEIDRILKDREVQLVNETIGDIVISIDRVYEQASEYEHSFEREFSYMLVHGFYHLMGYDHIDENDKALMRAKEEGILTKLNIIR